MPSTMAPGDVGSSQPSTPSTPSWKSILRLASPSSKRSNTRSTSMLSVDTTNIQNQLPLLTPSSVTSAEHRFSSNSTSSATQSSGSISNPTSLSSRPPPSSSRSITPAYSTSQLWSPDTQPPPPLNTKSSRSLLKTKSDKQRSMLGRSPIHLHPESGAQPIPIEQTRSANLPFQKSATRFIRRVASAPNTKGLFALGSRSTPAITVTKNGLLSPAMPPLPGQQRPSDNEHTSLETSSSGSSDHRTLVQNGATGGNRPKPTRVNSIGAGIVLASTRSKERMTGSSLGHEAPGRIAFRRTYSSHSIKVRSVEVSASSFQKIKMLGRGDVGKVYLVREKKTGKLFAMKGDAPAAPFLPVAPFSHCEHSPLKSRNDRAEEDQAGSDRAGDSCDSEPSVYRHTLPFISIGAISLFLHGVLYGRGVFPGSAKPSWKMPTRGSGPVLRRRGNRSVRVSAPHGFYLSGSQAREWVVLSFCLW